MLHPSLSAARHKTASEADRLLIQRMTNRRCNRPGRKPWVGRMQMKVITLLAVLFVAAVLTPLLIAQSLVSGDLTGTITDPTGAVVSNATVTVKSDANGSARTTTSNETGAYRFS